MHGARFRVQGNGENQENEDIGQRIYSLGLMVNKANDQEGKKWESFRISKFGNGLKISR